MVLPDSHWLPRGPWYSGTAPEGRLFSYGTLTRSGGTFQFASEKTRPPVLSAPQPRRDKPDGLGSNPFARRYLGYRVCFLFLRVLRCFSSPRAPLPTKGRWPVITPAGLPHSETCGSVRACRSPQRFVAWHVLPRPTAPRHSPEALSCFRDAPSHVACSRPGSLERGRLAPQKSRKAPGKGKPVGSLKGAQRLSKRACRLPKRSAKAARGR